MTCATKCFTLRVMNLKYLKVSLFEISYKKKLTFSPYLGRTTQAYIEVRGTYTGKKITNQPVEVFKVDQKKGLYLSFY